METWEAFVDIMEFAAWLVIMVLGFKWNIPVIDLTNPVKVESVKLSKYQWMIGGS